MLATSINPYFPISPCPSCQMAYEDGPHGTLQQLGRAIRVLDSHAELDVEFVLPVKD